MEFNNKRLERTSKFINIAIAVILCMFLIALSGKILGDVDDWKERPVAADFENKELIAEKQEKIADLEKEMAPILEERESIKNTLQIARSDHQNAKASFENWLAARKTVGKSSEDEEVLSRAKKLDEFYKTEQSRRREFKTNKSKLDDFNQKIGALNTEIAKERNRAYDEVTTASRSYELKVFLIRLMFILPILLLGVYFAVRFRKHKYWPLFLGFVLFSVYAFFFGLIPYLPSYGGYVRYTVGIILSIVAGAYAINKIRAFVERKKEELKVSTTERAKGVRTETAEKALDNHMCPSCGKDFIVKKWDKSISKENKSDHFAYVTNFCRFCGLKLFKDCDNCQTTNFAHLPFCSNCGNGISEKPIS